MQTEKGRGRAARCPRPLPPAGPRPPGPRLPAHAAGTAPRAGPPGARGAPPERGSRGGRRGAGAWSSVGGQVPGSTKCRSTGLRGERESGPKLALERGHRSENLPDRRMGGRQGCRRRGGSLTATPAPPARPAAPWGPSPAAGEHQSTGASCGTGRAGTDARDPPGPGVPPQSDGPRLPAPARPALSHGECGQHRVPQPRAQDAATPLLHEHGTRRGTRHGTRCGTRHGPARRRAVPWRLRAGVPPSLRSRCR